MTEIKREIRANYKTLAQIKEETNTTADTIAAFVAAVGYAAAVETIAAAVNCKAWDGRISDKNRTWAAENTTEGGEGVYLPGIDRIHPAHLDQIADRMRRTPHTTKTVYFTPDEIGRGLNWDDIHAADALGVGMLEQVLPDLIAFHSIEPDELQTVLDWVADWFALDAVDVSTYEQCGCLERETDEERVQIGRQNPTPTDYTTTTTEDTESEIITMTATEATYTLNEAHNGVEITFSTKPTADTLATLKQNGFRWHRGGGYWYAKQTPERLALAEQITNGATEAPKTAGKVEKKTATKGTPQNRIKIYYNGFRLDGSKELTKCGYSLNGADGVTIYADGYGADLPRDLFEVRNDSDPYTDYFDKDRATVTDAHPLFKYIYYAAMKQNANSAKRHIVYLEKCITAYGKRYEEQYRKEIERARGQIAAFEAMTDPGQPTAEDLAEIDRQRQEEENRRRAEEHAAQLAERERVLNERCEGRKYIESIADAYPIEDGAPVVEIEWSEHPAFYSWTDSQDKVRVEVIINADGTREERTIIEEPRRRCLLSVAAADIVLKHFDEIEHAKKCGYDKTGFVITWTDENGEESRYEGRYDLGDNDGGLIEHINALAQWDLHHDKYGHETEEEQPISADRLAWVELLKRYDTRTSAAA